VLLKLSSQIKLRNFDTGMKMIAVAPHRLVVSPCKNITSVLDIIKLVWAIVLFIPRQCEGLI